VLDVRVDVYGAQARTRLEAVQRGVISEAEVRQKAPIGFGMHASGPSIDFALGRIYAAATDEAYDRIVKRDSRGIDLPVADWRTDDELQKIIAGNEFRARNCRLLKYPALPVWAGPDDLAGLMAAALETGSRKGELLSLTWRDRDLTRREITLRAEPRRRGRGASCPFHSPRLAAVRAMATTDPAGQTLPPEARVFGDAVGRPVKDIKKAWETALLKAHGHAPTWTRINSLAPTSRAVFASINLTFHDLRHEAGSRLLEAGWPIHSVAHMLGHANISQTSTYLNATRVGLQDAMRRLDASRCNSVAQAVETDRAPLGNDGQPGTEQVTVN
jgi:integrase